MHRIKNKTLKLLNTNFCQSELEFKKFDIFAELELKKIKFLNSNLNSDLQKLIELELNLELE